MGELELICSSKEEVADATERIGQMGTSLGLTMAAVKGQLRSKVAMLLMTERPEHYSALVVAKVI